MAKETRSFEEIGRSGRVLDSYTDELKIPKERVAILLGKKGVNKRRLEKRTGTKLTVNSKEGDVVITGKDSLKVFTSKHIVQAIGRGFNPSVAQQLTNEAFMFELIDMQSFTGKSKKKMVRLKSRIIGLDGNAWKMLEKLTGTTITVYGKTVGIIGRVDEVTIARQAVENLLNGSPHGNVYQWIEKQKWQLKHLEG